MQEKLKTALYSEQIQILTLVPDTWFQKHCSEYFNDFECLVWTAHEFKKVGGILAKSPLKKGKTITNEALHLLTSVYMKLTISVGQCLERNTTWVKEYINKNFVTCKSLCNLQELHTAFKEKHPNLNIGFSKLRPKWCVLASSELTGSACICSSHQNVALLVDAMDWDLTYKDLIKKIVCNTESNKCIMHRCESCPGTATLKEFLDQVNMKMMRNLITVSGTLRIEQYWQYLQPLMKNAKRLWLMLLMI